MKNQINIQKDIKVFVDPKTSARTIAIPFRLPDGTSAVCMICRLKNQEWDPTEIKNIVINYEKRNSSTTTPRDIA